MLHNAKYNWCFGANLSVLTLYTQFLMLGITAQALFISWHLQHTPVTTSTTQQRQAALHLYCVVLLFMKVYLKLLS